MGHDWIQLIVSTAQPRLGVGVGDEPVRAHEAAHHADGRLHQAVAAQVAFEKNKFWGLGFIV